MRDWQGKGFWLVGATGGLGGEVALALSRLGCALTLSDGGDAEHLAARAARLPGRARAVPLDVADRSAVEAAARDAGPLDGLVHLAAELGPMRARDWDAGRALAVADAGIMGALRLVGAVLPGMVARGGGHIVLSAPREGGAGAVPDAAGAAVTALARGLRAELTGAGVLVQLVRASAAGAPGDDSRDAAEARAIVEHMGTAAFAGGAPALPAWLRRGGRLLPARGR